MKRVIILVFLIIPLFGHSQKRRKIPKAIVTWRHSFQQNDYLMGIDAGIINEKQNLIWQIVGDFRPFSRKVQEFIGNNTFYQYSERRYVIGLGMEYQHAFNNGNKGVFLGLNGVHNFGEYRGVSYKPENGWSLLPRAGMFLNVFHGVGYAKLGYQYRNSRSDTVMDHWVFLSFSIILDPTYEN